MYERLILKLSGEALSNDNENIDVDKLSALAESIKVFTDNKIKLGIVVGGGNFARGRSLSKLGLDRSASDHIGMLGTVMNAIALTYALKSVGIKAQTFSALQIEGVEKFESEKAKQLYEEGTVLVFGGGVGNPYFSTDSCCALRACQLNAEMILIAKNGVDGVYDDDPKSNPNAKRYDKLSFNDILTNRLQVIDATAAGLCQDNGIKAFVFDMNEEGNLLKALNGEAVGTYII